MKKRLLFIMTALIALLLIVTFVIGCSNADDQDHNGDNPSQGVETPDGSDEEKTIDADVVLFIGQSNMAGRGDSSAATAVEEGHAFEFRAISDPTRLYPLQEPFGAAEHAKKTAALRTESGFCLPCGMIVGRGQQNFRPPARRGAQKNPAHGGVAPAHGGAPFRSAARYFPKTLPAAGAPPPADRRDRKQKWESLSIPHFPHTNPASARSRLRPASSARTPTHRCR